MIRYKEYPFKGQSTPFIDWVQQNENGFFEAWKSEDVLQKKYEDIQDDAMDDVLRALATMKSADSRIQRKVQ